MLPVFAALFFQRSRWAGAVVLGVLVLRPEVAALAVLALALAAGCLHGAGRRPADEPTALANAALVGVGIAAFGASLPLAIGLILLGTAMVVPITLVLDAPLRRRGASALSLPFTLVLWALILAVHPAAPVASPGTWSTGWIWPDAFLRSFCALLYRSDVASGLLLALLVLIHSRVLMLTAMIGFTAGCLTNWLWSPTWYVACSAPTGFNATLAGMAVGAVLLVPGPGSLLAAVLAGAAAALLAAALGPLLAPLAVPVFTAPFVIATLVAVRAVALLSPGLLPVVIEATPEATLSHHAALQRRFNGRGWDIALPVAGAWSVWQGEDGPWTHQGPWRHAIDLVARDEDGHLHRGGGGELEDWHTFGRPVLAPVDGTVVAVVDGVADNPIGRVDSQRNWGNLVIIADPRGFHVELSHLRCGSLRVAIGQWVVRGQVLGECGNSGCSSQPHLHVQAQAFGRVGDHTVPFRFGVHRCDGALVLDGLPPAGATVEPVVADADLARALDLVPGERLRFRAGRTGEGEHTRELRVGRALDGSLTLESARGRLILSRHAGSLRVWRHEGDDPWLALLHRALPSLPLCRLDGLVWRDHLPVTATRPGWRGHCLAFAGLFLPRLAVECVVLRGAGDRVVSSSACGACIVELDGGQGLLAVRGDGHWLRRICDVPVQTSLSLAS